MARLTAILEQSAYPEVRAVYDRVKTGFGKLLKSFSVDAIHPAIFGA